MTHPLQPELAPTFLAPARSRGITRARHEVMEMLRKDHLQVKAAFREFAQLQKTASLKEEDRLRCRALVQQTCAALIVHATLEERRFYPVVKEALNDAEPIEEAEVAHRSFEGLITQLREMAPDDEKFVATFTVLGGYVLHHQKEEEGAMFRKLMRVRLDWQQLLTSMQREREQLMDGQGDTILSGAHPLGNEAHREVATLTRGPWPS